MERSPQPEPRKTPGLGLLLAGLLLSVLLTACPKKPEHDRLQDAGGAVPEPKPTTVTTANDNANAAHGKELVATFQCSRCHDGTGHPAADPKKHCVHCHKDIMEDRFQAAAASIARWKPRVKELADAPSLEASGKRFTRKWVEGYLLQPSDLRPHLKQYMPRLAITADEARDIAAYLVPEPDAPAAPELKSVNELTGRDLGKGRKLLDTKGCGTCHVFTGVESVSPSAPPALDAKQAERSKKLAPDLRVTRERMTPAKLIAWLRDPKAVKPDSDMPKIDLTENEAKDLAAYIWNAEVAPRPAKPKVERLPLLTRKVSFQEVDEKVLHRTCWHCHSEPDFAIGDGGPGNSGGLGFKPRGLNLSEYAGIAAGYLDDKNERQSIFAKDAEGVPLLVRALLARHDEENGAPTGTHRGMPLGYDPLPREEIQLVDTWIAQGRPR